MDCEVQPCTNPTNQRTILFDNLKIEFRLCDKHWAAFGNGDLVDLAWLPKAIARERARVRIRDYWS